jgi:hypothetical protein
MASIQLNSLKVDIDQATRARQAAKDLNTLVQHQDAISVTPAHIQEMATKHGMVHADDRDTIYLSSKSRAADDK